MKPSEILRRYIGEPVFAIRFNGASDGEGMRGIGFAVAQDRDGVGPWLMLHDGKVNDTGYESSIEVPGRVLTSEDVDAIAAIEHAAELTIGDYYRLKGGGYAVIIGRRENRTLEDDFPYRAIIVRNGQPPVSDVTGRDEVEGHGETICYNVTRTLNGEPCF